MDDFADGWIEFEEFINNLMNERNLTIKDIEEYVKMYKEQNQK